MSLRAASVVLLAAMCARPAPAVAEPDDYDRLGRLEREEVDAVLKGRGLQVDRAPDGKTVRHVIIVSRPVFERRDGFLTFFNVFHRTTRTSAIARELLFHPGDRWDPERVDETLRGLRDPRFHNVLVILPVVSDEPGTVDVLVLTRDVWSLRLNSRYEVVGSTLTSLSFSLSENNLLGLRKRAALVFSMDQGEIQGGPVYDDPRLGGTGLALYGGMRLLFARANGKLEGTSSAAVLSYPFRSLRQRFSASLSATHVVAVARSFVGTKLRTYDAPDTPMVEAQPWVYRRRELVTEAQALASFGTDVLQRFGVGHQLSLIRPALVDGFPDDPTLRADFIRDVLPRSELASSVFAHWQLFTPIYAAYRDLETFDFREDYQLGPLLDARVSEALRALGSDRNFTRFSGSARLSAGWWGGLYRVSAGMSARLQDGSLIDRSHNLRVFAASPIVARALRLAAALNVDWLTDNTNNDFLVLGGSNGLRGYAINELSGQARALAHVELRTRPLRLGFYRLGAVAFWDAGDAAPTLADLSLKHAVGLGLRSLIPQLDPLVIRLDWAFALAGQARGWPGRLSLGVEQVF